MQQEQTQNQHKCNCTKSLKTLENENKELKKQMELVLSEIDTIKKALKFRGV